MGLQFLDDRRTEEIPLIVVRMIRHHGESKRKVYTHSIDRKILVRCHTNWEESHFQYM